MPSKTAGNTALSARLALGIGLWAATAAAEGRLLWSTPSHVRPGSSARDVALPEPVVGDGIVAWSTGRAIHAVRLDDGTPLAAVDQTRGSTELVSLPLLFPAAAAASDARLSRPCPHGGRLFATVTASAPAGEPVGRLVAIDCSRAGGGRVEWYAELPAEAVGFEGPPWVDGERVLAIVKGGGARGLRRLACYDLFDGRLLENRAVGDADRPPEEPPRRAAAGSDRFIVATERTIECRSEEARP